MPATRIDAYRQGGFYGDQRAHHRATAPNAKRVRRLQLPGLDENRARLRHVTQREVLLHRERVDVAAHAPMSQQRFQFRAEQEHTVIEQCVMQRLDTKPVTRQE